MLTKIRPQSPMEKLSIDLGAPFFAPCELTANEHSMYIKFLCSWPRQVRLAFLWHATANSFANKLCQCMQTLKIVIYMHRSLIFSVQFSQDFLSAKSTKSFFSCFCLKCRLQSNKFLGTLTSQFTQWSFV